MLKIDDNIIRVHGFVEAMHGMRQPYKGTEKGDSRYNNRFEEVGPKDLELAKQLAVAGPVHAKYRRMICVWVDITAPLYWWKEFDTYKVGTVANSESTMHTIEKKEFEIEDFSHEHLTPFGMASESPIVSVDDGNVLFSPYGSLLLAIRLLNKSRELYLETHDKRHWWQMIQLLPSSYNQTRTVMLNYEVLSHIYDDRRNHKLDEWHTFCDWIEKLPYAAEMIFPEVHVKEDELMISIKVDILRNVLKYGFKEGFKEGHYKCSDIADLFGIPESIVRAMLSDERSTKETK